MKIKCILACLIISLLVQNVSAQVFNILPYPNKLETTTKGQFDLNTTIEIASAITDPMVTPTIQLLKEIFSNVEVTYFGIFTFLAPILNLIISQKKIFLIFNFGHFIRISGKSILIFIN